MLLGFKKWYSVLGLLIAIVISLGIGAYFNFSIFEGAETLDPIEETTGEENSTEPTLDETSGDSTSMSTPKRRRRRKQIDETNTDTSIESFSLIQNF